ncbi:MAG: hypothetical protein V5783_01995 [Pontiella sp.]
MNKLMKIRGVFLVLSVLLLGCASPSEMPEPVIDQDATMEVVGSGLRPEVLLFPEYLLMEGLELHQHGRVPNSELVGAGLRSPMNLSQVRGRFLDILEANGWKTTKQEVERQSFRILAAHRLEHIEIRGVQGTGPTEVFMFYRPEPTINPFRLGE